MILLDYLCIISKGFLLTPDGVSMTCVSHFVRMPKCSTRQSLKPTLYLLGAIHEVRTLKMQIFRLPVPLARFCTLFEKPLLNVRTEFSIVIK